MISRRESLQRFLRLSLLLPIGLGACAGEMDPAIEDEELAVSGSAPDDAEVFVTRLDPATAHKHKAAMDACLTRHGVALPAGPIRVRFESPPGEGRGPRRKVLFRVDDTGAPDGEPVEVTPVDEATQKAFAACIAEVGTPGTRRR